MVKAMRSGCAENPSGTEKLTRLAPPVRIGTDKRWAEISAGPTTAGDCGRVSRRWLTTDGSSGSRLLPAMFTNLVWTFSPAGTLEPYQPLVVVTGQLVQGEMVYFVL